MGTQKEGVSPGVSSKAFWANLDKDAMLKLEQDLSRRLHKRWAKAERAMTKIYTPQLLPLLLVSKNFMLTILAYTP
jgi:hypothetical protein